MNVVHLITSIDKGGAENHLASLARGLKNKNIKIYVIYLKGNGFWKKYYSKLGIKVINLSKIKGNFNGTFKKINFLINFYKIHKIDIVHAHLPHMEIYGFLSLMLSRKKIRFFITKHLDNNIIGGSNYKYNSFIANFVNNIIFLKASKIITISNSVKKFFLKDIFKANSNKFKLIYYGINKSYIRLLENKKFSYKKLNLENKLIFGSIGRLVKQKNFHLLIESFSLLIKKYKIDSYLIIAGDGPEKKSLVEYSRKKQVYDKIIWTGNIKYVGNFFKKIDIFCMTSKYEGLGLVLLEALAYSKPIITPNLSAFPEVIKNNSNGLLVKKYDALNYSKSMLKMTNFKFRKKLTKNSKNILYKKFKFETMVNKTLNLYKK